MVKWANETVKKGGKTSTMKSFKDSSLSTGIFFLDLLNGIKPGYVDYSLVTPGRDAEEKRQNGMHTRHGISAQPLISCVLSAKLAISIARKLNALIFLVPEGRHQHLFDPLPQKLIYIFRSRYRRCSAPTGKFIFALKVYALWKLLIYI